VTEAGPAAQGAATAPAAALQPGAVAAARAPGVAPTAPAPGEPRRRISPAARKRAQELGVDPDALAGTGPDGAVTVQDVERTPAPTAQRQAEMRRAIGAAMSRSKREIPHYYLTEAIPMRAAQDWLVAANAQRGIAGRVLMAVLQLKAVALALGKCPDLNGFFIDGAYRPARAVHAGVAIALRQGGLIAPALHDVADKPLDQLMGELTGLVARARAGSLRSSEMSDPTITVTNLGEQGVDAVLGVIYPPQVALVGFGRVAERPWVRDGGLFVLPAATASLAADHRVTDGHYGALFLAELRERLQHPDQL
jgi:pyruvate dehydrogenase E2 component (dihydrolipoamide acetyltransferase)